MLANPHGMLNYSWLFVRLSQRLHGLLEQNKTKQNMLGITDCMSAYYLMFQKKIIFINNIVQLTIIYENFFLHILFQGNEKMYCLKLLKCLLYVSRASVMEPLYEYQSKLFQFLFFSNLVGEAVKGCITATWNGTYCPVQIESEKDALCFHEAMKIAVRLTWLKVKEFTCSVCKYWFSMTF